MAKKVAYNLANIRPLEVRPLTNPESVQKPWGILISEPQARRGQP